MIVIVRERGFTPYCGRVLDDCANPIAGVSVIGRRYDGSVVAEATAQVDGTWGLPDFDALDAPLTIEIISGATKITIDSMSVSVDVSESRPWWRRVWWL